MVLVQVGVYSNVCNERRCTKRWANSLYKNQHESKPELLCPLRSSSQKKDVLFTLMHFSCALQILSEFDAKLIKIKKDLEKEVRFWVERPDNLAEGILCPLL